MIDVPEAPHQPREPRRVIPATCTTHSGARGYTNLVVTKRGGHIELDPHVTCYPEVRPGRDARYCPECVEATRFSAEAGDPSARAGQDDDSQPHGYFVGGCGHRVPLVGATWHVGPCGDCDPSAT